MRRSLLCLLACSIGCAGGGGRTLRVPENYPTLATALEVAGDGDRIFVGQGVFEVDKLTFDGGRYTIQGEGVDRTVLLARDGDLFDARDANVELREMTLRSSVRSAGQAVRSHRGRVVWNRVHADGFEYGVRIEHGQFEIRESSVRSDHPSGVGLHLECSSGVIAKTVIRDHPINGIFATSKTPDCPESSDIEVRESVFSRNLFALFATGAARLAIEDCVFAENINGVSLREAVEARIDRSIFFRNGFAIKISAEPVVVRDSIFVEQQLPVLAALKEPRALFRASHNLTWNNAAGLLEDGARAEVVSKNFVEADPMFVAAEQGDFRLQPGSPAVGYGPRHHLGAPAMLASNSKAATAVRVDAQIVPESRKHALVIGLQNYAAVKPLKYAHRDAEAVAAHLESEGYEVKLLTEATSPLATIPVVKNELIRLTSAAGPEDSVVIYYSGHGSNLSNPLGSGRGFLLLKEAQESNVASTALPLDDIRNAINRIAAQRVVLILDTCFAGNAAKSVGSTSSGKDTESSLTEDLAYGRGKIALYSSRDNEASLESDQYKHGYFTYHLLQAWILGLRGLDEVYAHVFAEVTKSTRQQQHPRQSAFEAEGKIPTY